MAEIDLSKLEETLERQKPYIAFASIHWDTAFMGHFTGNPAADRRVGSLLKRMHRENIARVEIGGVLTVPALEKLLELDYLRKVIMPGRKGFYHFSGKAFFRMSDITQHRRASFPTMPAPMTPDEFTRGITAPDFAGPV